MGAVKLVQVGDSLGVALPEEVLARLNAQEGDTVFPTETPHGLAIISSDSARQEQMDAAREIMEGRRQTLKELGK